LDTELWSLLKSGGVAMWIIAGCSVLAIAVGLERLIALWR